MSSLPCTNTLSWETQEGAGKINHSSANTLRFGVGRQSLFNLTGIVHRIVLAQRWPSYARGLLYWFVTIMSISKWYWPQTWASLPGCRQACNLTQGEMLTLETSFTVVGCPSPLPFWVWKPPSFQASEDPASQVRESRIKLLFFFLLNTMS